MKTVSIILPTFRPSHYLYECLDSLVNQNVARNVFDIHIILNGEKQPFYDEILNYLARVNVNNFHLHYCEEKGVSRARNLGICLSESKYLIFLDDDDCLSCNYISSLVSQINGREHIIIVSNLQTFGGDTNKKDYIANAFQRCKNKGYSLFNFRGFLSSVWGKIIPRTIIGSNTFNINLTISEDALFMFQISKDIERIELSSDDCLYRRRIRMESASRKQKYLHVHFKIFIRSCYNFTRVYLSSPFHYDFPLYLSRILASLKVFIMKVSKTRITVK